MECIEVLHPGFMTTIQDLGRADYGAYGVPVCGAMDTYSLRLANLLAGNLEDAAAVEATLLGPKLKLLKDADLAITGADLSPMLNGKPCGMWKTLRVHAGDKLEFGRNVSGCRTYIAIGGGIEVPAVMGSRSTFLRGGYGGLDGRTLCAGDVLSSGSSGAAGRVGAVRRIRQQDQPDFREDRPVRFIAGPQLAAFQQEALHTLTTHPYVLTNQSDRMGARLEGPLLRHKQGADIISDATVIGSIQVPGNGQPIILLADSQVTGGYTKIGTVIGVDLPYFVQKKPGDKVRFAEVGIAEAQRLWCEQERRMHTMRTINCR